MQDNNFDRIIRERLEGLQVPYEPADWEVLADRLDHPHEAYLRKTLAGMEVPFEEGDTSRENDWFAMEDVLEKDFDKAIQEKLHDLDLAYKSADWPSMEAKISHPLDAAVRNGLEGTTIPYLPGDWEVMEETLDKPFDELVKGKLSDHSVAFRKADWRRMSALLRGKDEPVPLYANWRMYAAAAALLFLFLLGGRQIWGPIGTPAGNSVEESFAVSAAGTAAESTSGTPEISTPVQGSTTDGAENLEKEAQIATNEGTSSNSLIEANDKPKGEVVLENKTNRNANNTIQPIELEGVRPSQVNLAGAGNSELVPSKRTNLEFSPYISFHTKPISVDPGSITEGADMENGIAMPAEGSIDRTSSKGTLQTTTLALAPVGLDADRGPRFGTFKLDQNAKADFLDVPLRAYPRVAVGLYGATFSSVSQFNDEGISGWAAGPRVELKLNAGWSLVTGLLYAEKQFEGIVINSKEENPLAGNQEVNWPTRLHADYRMLELPVMAKYTFESENRISFYMQAGIATMITLKEHYQDFDPLTLENGIEESLASSSVVNLDALAPSDQAQSINTYVGNVQFAPGLQARLGSNLSLQLEPYLQLGFQRMGPRKRKIHSSGVAFSINYFLGKK